MLTRKEVLKILSTIPAGGLLAGGLLDSAVGGPVTPDLASESESITSGPLSIGPNLFRSINVEPLINCRGTFTIIGGSIEHPHVKAAMSAAPDNFIQYVELADGIGARLAGLSGGRWGGAHAGCAADFKQ